MKKLFGTDGVRGIANTEPMTVETALQLGRAAGYVFKNGDRRHSIVIGKDTRLSGYMIENALVAGICSMGVDVLIVGPLPTPGIAFITRSLRADAGIVISASHNTYEYNGIKFFSSDGHKLPTDLERRMEQLVSTGEIDDIRPTNTAVGKAYRIDDALGRYVEFVKNSFPKGMTLDGLNIVVDCANGALYKCAPCVFRELGASIYVYSNHPDGININHECGSLHTEVIRKGVIDHKADIGIAFDGDGDRVILADEDAYERDGDYVMAICGIDMIKKGELKNNIVVNTVMSNMGLDIAIEQAGGQVVKAAIGDRFVLEQLRKTGGSLGGEQSGHVIFRDYTTTGDALISALQVLRIMKETGKPLSHLSKYMEKYPQELRNIPVRKKEDFDKIPALQKAIDDAKKKLGKEGRILVRYSGTEAVARVMVEGRNGELIVAIVNEISDLIAENLG